MAIQILSEETINKIAAGEVIERPSNVVKELLENSIDANSSNIDIEIKSAGRQLIRVRDDGTGMSREDSALSVTRHATSKITDFSDIETLRTLGFRGEALTSIASVSHLLIQSQTRNSNSGWEIKLSAGKMKESRSWAGSYGTNVEVANLFYNTPARAKFLKSDTTERHRILRIIEETSLAWQNVAFNVLSENKQVLCAPKTKTLLERIIDVLGKSFGESIIPFEAVHPNIKVWGYVTRPQAGAASKENQFFFVNNRPVTPSKAFMYNLYEAYRENLISGRHPGAVIFIEIDPSEIDVNIHPTKREIRFSKEQEICRFLYTALKECLSKTPPVSYSLPENKNILELRHETNSSVREPFGNYYRKNHRPNFQGQNTIIPALKNNLISVIEIEAHTRSIGQAFGLYVISENNDELLIIDQHAAAERIRYEKYLEQWKNRKIPVQPMLIPLTIELPPSQMGLLKENISLIKEAGWEIEEFGINTARITALPGILGTNIEMGNILSEMLNVLKEEPKIPQTEKIEKIIRAACRASIKAGDRISQTEIDRLLNDLFNTKAPYTCPHGRPTMLKLSRHELEKYFRR